MLQQKQSLINELTTPLFRLKPAFNHGDTAQTAYAGHILGFHVGNGIVVSVAHHLRTSLLPLYTLTNNEFLNVLRPLLTPVEQAQFDASYQLNQQTNKRYFSASPQLAI